MATVPCPFCDRLVNTEAKGVYQRTRGWVQRRAGGGGHSVALPEREPEWAHSWCVDRASRGWLTQEELFGDKP